MSAYLQLANIETMTKRTECLRLHQSDIRLIQIVFHTSGRNKHIHFIGKLCCIMKGRRSQEIYTMNYSRHSSHSRHSPHPPCREGVITLLVSFPINFLIGRDITPSLQEG